MIDWHTLYEVIIATIGGIDPVGSSTYDEKAKKNLEILMDLTDELLMDICRAAKYASRQEWSMSQGGQAAQKWLKTEVDYIQEILNEGEEK